MITTHIVVQDGEFVVYLHKKLLLKTPIKKIALYFCDRIDTMIEHPDHDYEECLEEMFKAI